jgi:hypothetical protein
VRAMHLRDARMPVQADSREVRVEVEHRGNPNRSRRDRASNQSDRLPAVTWQASPPRSISRADACALYRRAH